MEEAEMEAARTEEARDGRGQRQKRPVMEDKGDTDDMG
jgi:hypothetical protein